MAQQIRLFGSLEITENGCPAPIMKSQKGCALLAYLVVTGQSQPREVVADLLWESDSTRRSLARLRDLLRRIRPLLPDLIITPHLLSYHPRPTTDIDYRTFQQGLAQTDNLTTLDEALSLYQGDLLANFYLPETPPFNEWLSLTREKLRQQVNIHSRQLCYLYAQRREWSRGTAVAQRWLNLDPLHEAAHRWLMRFLAGQEDFDAALAQYDQCQHLLWEALAVEPAQPTRELAEQIQAEAEQHTAISPLPSADALPAPGLLPAHSIMPHHRNNLFTGREADLQAIARHLLRGTDQLGLPHVVALTGMGGLGKTQLAVEYVYRYGRYYAGGVFWLSFAEPDTIAEEVIAINEQSSLGLFPTSTRLSQAQKVALVRQAWHEPISRLLIFDNCESVSALTEWLPKSGGCQVLLTSRRGNWPKELPLTERPLAVWPRQASIQFIQQLAIHLTEQDADAIADKVGDLPLALQLVGYYLAQQPQVTPADYLAHLQATPLLQHASLQGQSIHYSPTSHELHVARTFALSLAQQDLTNPTDQMARRLLAHVACFAPGEPVPHTLLRATVTDENTTDIMVERGIQRLIVLGLLNRQMGGMVMLHRLLVAFTWDVLGETEMVTAATAVARTLIYSLQAHLQQHTSLSTLPFGIVHLRHAAQQLTGVPTPQTAELTYLLGVYLRQMAVYDEAESCLHKAHQLFTDSLGVEQPQTANVLAELGQLFFDRGQYQAVFAYYEQALAIRQATLGLNHPDTARSLNSMGSIYLRLGEYAKGRPYMEQALAIREATLGSEHPETTQSLNNLGVLHDWLGDTAQAQPYFERVLAIRERQLGTDHVLTASSLNNLGDLLSRRGKYAAGRPLLEQAVAIRKKHLGAQHPLTLTSMMNLGVSLKGSGELGMAEAVLLEVVTAVGITLEENHPLTARVYNRLGELYTGNGRCDEALPYLEKALDIRQLALGDTHQDTDYSRICLGELYQASGRIEEAMVLFQQASTHLEQSLPPDHEDVQRAHQNLAAAALLQD